MGFDTVTNISLDQRSGAYLAQCTNQVPDRVLSQPIFSDLGGVVNDQHGWQFFVDTDFAGNAEVQNKRRSQVGILSTLNYVPVFWKSSVIQCYANENFDEDHPDRSSGASETRGVANATADFPHLSYIVREAGIKFPTPFVLQIDNGAARIFAMDTCFRSRMKHIDCAQEWGRILRDRQICLPSHVNTDDNLADILAKILSIEKFRIMRGRVMVERAA